MTWLRILHLLGLTNLSTDEVQNYEEMVRIRSVRRDVLRLEQQTLSEVDELEYFELQSIRIVVPLPYWIVLVLTLVTACGGVYLFTSFEAGFSSPLPRMIGYALCNYGLAIFAIFFHCTETESLLESEVSQKVISLLERLEIRRPISPIALLRELKQPGIANYRNTFVRAFLLSSFGTAFAFSYFDNPHLLVPDLPLNSVFWTLGLAAAVVAVYISYRLDRDIYLAMPNIEHSPVTFGWCLLNCLGLAATCTFLILPLLYWWNDLDSKPLFIWTVMTFCVTFGLAIVTQFAAMSSVLRPFWQCRDVLKELSGSARKSMSESERVATDHQTGRPREL